MSEGRFPHLGAGGEARMVDVSGKAVTARSATAGGRVLLSAECVAALRDGTVPKGDALAVARIAGIQAAKKTPDLIPLCHPLFISGVDVATEVTDEGVEITATVKTTDRTGVGRACSDRHDQGHRSRRGDQRRTRVVQVRGPAR